MVQILGGWFLVSIRPLRDSEGIVGSVAVGKLIDFNSLADMNFGRSDPSSCSLVQTTASLLHHFHPAINQPIF
ncbi:MAG: hypothetical protein DSY79_08810 [Chloroflexi bacterium]|nr:MAG: hypothetical protein DSY79_08810 [Chloroflexota bacterium]